jgi:tripartite-type tricarboxylate transporter receptor subunit TctC
VIASVPNVIVIHPKHAGIKTYQDFLAYAEGQPGKLNFGSAGNGTSHHLVGELYKLRTGTDIVHVPYKGAGPDDAGPHRRQRRPGLRRHGHRRRRRSRPASCGRSRSPPPRARHYPRGPDAHRARLPTSTSTSWYAIWVPKGTPKEITDKLYSELVKALQLPDVKAMWEQQGAVAGGQPPAEFGRFVHSEVLRWGKVVKDANIKIDN